MNNIIKYYKGEKLHDSFPERFSTYELCKENIMRSEVNECDFIVTATLEEMIPFINAYKSTKKYIIWCDEPLWSNIFAVLKRKLIYFHNNKIYEFKHEDSIEVNVMNCFTGEIYFNNYHFLEANYLIDKNSVSLAKKSLYNYKDKKNIICAIMGYKNSEMWNFSQDAYNIYSLCNIRTEIALIGYNSHKIDIYGKDWPNNIAISESRTEKDFSYEKFNIAKKYRYNLCFENTVCPFYITEKIWHSIICGCIPIYYGSKINTIYNDFPKLSFIDYADYLNPLSLIDYISKITYDEYEYRMNLCIKVLERSLYVNRFDNSKMIQLKTLRLRMQSGTDVDK